MMVANYNLRPNEVVLLKEDRVLHGGRMATYTDELMLTNFNLIVTKKGMFGNAKGVLTFPVNQIKVHEGNAQAALGKTSSGNDALEVYFLNGQEQFGFATGGKKKVAEWISKIHYVVTGEEATQQAPAGKAVPGAEMVAGMLRDTLGVFKSKMGPAVEAPAKVAAKCRSCGAPLTGLQGRAATCEYCGSAQQM